jgi:DNA polymerase-3 subunit gamma/tau
LLELLCGRMLLPAASSDNAALLQRLELIERRLTTAAPPAESTASEPRPAAAERGSTRQPSRAQPGRAQPDRAVAGPPAAAPPSQSTTAPPSQPAAASRSQPAAAPSSRSAAASSPRPVAGPSSQPAAEASSRSAAEEPARTPAARAEGAGGGHDTTAVRRQWPEVVDRVGKRSRVTFALMSGSSVQAIDGDTLVVAASTAAMAKRLSEQRHVDQIAEAMRETFGVAWRVRFADPGGGSPAATGTAATGAAGAVAPAPVAAPPSRRQPAQRQEPPASRGQERPSRPRPPVRDEVPPPDEPPTDDEEALLAEAAADDDGGNGQRRDPEEIALELLADQLGARKIN